MKVNELIEKLSQLPATAQVVVTKSAGGPYTEDYFSLSSPWVDAFGDVRLHVSSGGVTEVTEAQ